jgi:hypothetical protein
MTPSATIVVPPPDPLGLPAPPALLLALMMGTFFLHVVFMNFVLGGTLLAIPLNLAAAAGNERMNRLARIIHQILPPSLSFAITAGVAPLLFVQLLYGHLFYTSNVLLGFTWLSLVALLLIGFYSIHTVAVRCSNAMSRRHGIWDDRPGRRAFATALAAACVLGVAWIFTVNHVMTIRPDLWIDQGRWRRLTILPDTVVTLPRFAHNLVGAIVITGVWVAAIGHWRRHRLIDDEFFSTAVIRLGLKITLGAMIVQIAIGLWYVFALRPVWADLFGFRQPLGSIWHLAFFFIAAQIYFFCRALKTPERVDLFLYGLINVVASLIGMLCGREQVRIGHLARLTDGQAFHVNQWPVHTQTLPMLLFFAVLAIASFVIAILIRWVTQRPSPAETPAHQPPPPTGE